MEPPYYIDEHGVHAIDPDNPPPWYEEPPPRPPLHEAAWLGDIVSLDWADETPLESAITISRIPRICSKHRLCPILLRAGADFPRAEILSEPIWRAGEAYVKRVKDAGSFAAYERRHVNALAASFGPKLGLLPEIARVVVRFAFHCGYY